MASTQAPSECMHVSKTIGPLPLLNIFIERLDLDRFFSKLVPAGDRRQKLPPAVGLGIILRNILIARRPLYGLTEWVSRYEPALLGVSGEDQLHVNDDRLGRCLDALFRAERNTLMTEIVVHAVKEFRLELTELHNDSTTITFSGEHAAADGTAASGGIPTRQITYGMNKDFRPDLKQLLFILTTTADGAVPIFSNIDDGNTTDDGTHIYTWESLCKITGSPDFLYVADCKLCNKENLAYIATRGGRFVTVIPATWSEHRQFHQWLLSNSAPWTEVLRQPDPRNKKKTIAYSGYEHPMHTAQGFRVLWYHSSQKRAIDLAARQHRLEAAEKELKAIAARVGQPRARLNTAEQIRDAAEKVLEQRKVERFIHIEVKVEEKEIYTQASPGRPGPHTAYKREISQSLALSWHTDDQALEDEMRTDGIFPLITNDKKLTVKDALVAYKHQPYLEKRHQQLKSFLEVRPVMLKSHLRIEAFLFLYFLALMVEALIEREIRGRMKEQGIKTLPLYPEERKCSAPTTERLVELFADLRRHRLVDSDGRVRQRFYDELTETQRTALGIFGISTQKYLTYAENLADD
jgi:transposase